MALSLTKEGFEWRAKMTQIRRPSLKLSDPKNAFAVL